jgi:hypothetical protein
MAAAASKHTAGEAAGARPHKAARVAQFEDVRCWLPTLALDKGMCDLVEHLRQVGISLTYGAPLTGCHLGAPHANFDRNFWGNLYSKPVPEGVDIAVGSRFHPDTVEPLPSAHAEERWVEARGGGAWVVASVALVYKSKIDPCGDFDDSNPAYFLKAVPCDRGSNTTVRMVSLAATDWCENLTGFAPCAASWRRPLARALWLHGRECYEVRAALLATESWCLDTVRVVVSYL